MAKLTLGQKANRVLKLLLGLRNPRALAALTAHGFRGSDLEEGWRLLRSQAKVAFDLAPAPNADPSLIEKLDQWENAWFPIAHAALRRHFPAVRDKVFLNLSQTEGPAVIISVGTLVDRVAALSDGDEESQKAGKLLSERGLTSAVLEEARALLKQLGSPAAGTPENLEKQRVDAIAAEAELWSWYLEWGQIARTVISDRRLLRELGFLQSSSGRVEDDGDADGAIEDAPDDEPLEGLAPASATPKATAATPKLGLPGSNPFTE